MSKTGSSPMPVICIGAIHFDTLAYANETIRRDTSTPCSLSSKPGGVATNIARSLVRLGIPTTLVGTVGEDSAGNSLKTVLSDDGIKTCLVSRAGFSTGQYVAFHDPDGSLAAAVVDDRILSEAPDDVFDRILKELRDQTDAALWFVDANLPGAILDKVSRIAEKQTLVANAVSEAKAPRLDAILGRLDYLLLNRGEAISMTGSNPEENNRRLLKNLHDRGVGTIVMTQGASDTLISQGENVISLSPLETNIVDVTGAGDALSAGTIAALAKGHAPIEAVEIGANAARLTLQAPGALADNLSWQAVSTS